MSGKFIYVFTQRDAEIISSHGYHLIRIDTAKDIYVFENKPDQKFDLIHDFVLSDVLTF